MSDYYKCPECNGEECITTIHDTLFTCDRCDITYNPQYIHE